MIVYLKYIIKLIKLSSAVLCCNVDYVEILVKYKL